MAKQKKQSFSYWLSQKRSTIIVAAVIILLLFWLFGFNFVKIAGLNRQKQDLNAQIKAQQEKSDQLDAEIKQIGTQAYTEYIARKNLNLYYPNEQIVVTVENNQNAAPSTTAPSPSPSPSAAGTGN